jgi:heme-degrading monooxygenase HmoA
MLVIVWEYEVKPDRIDDFESFYRPDGPWTSLFRSSPAFLSTTLMKDLRKKGRYMVADRWMSESMYEEFKQAHRQAYDQMSERGHRLITAETEVGRFDFLE